MAPGDAGDGLHEAESAGFAPGTAEPSMSERAAGEPTTDWIPAPGAPVRLFAAARSAPAARRLADLVEVIGMLAGLLLLAAWAVPPRPFDAALAAFLASAPSWLASFWSAVSTLTMLPPLVIAIAALLRRRWRIALLMLTAAVIAAGTAIWLTRLYDTHVELFRQGVGSGATTWPLATLAVAGAASVSAWPELVVPARRLAIWALALAAIAETLAGEVTVTAVIGGLMVAAVAGGASRLALGTSAGHLEIDEVERLVSAIGVSLASIGESERRSDGELVIPAVTADGVDVTVKVHGRDAIESRFASRIWRAALYRDGAGALTNPRPPGL